MTFYIPGTIYNGAINEVKLGKGRRTLTVGGENSFPFYLFEGKLPHKPGIAMEVWDSPPVGWVPAVLKPFADVVYDPVVWAQKCVRNFGADVICLHMVSTDPNGLNRSVKEAADIAKGVAEAIDVPLIIWGTSNTVKDIEIFQAISQSCRGYNIAFGPVEEKGYQQLVSTAIENQHVMIASSPIDANLAKQLNILIGNMGISDGPLLMDPTVSSIGYGIEYCYSVMERIRIAALTQNDEKLQYPLICNIGKETWETKEVKISEADDMRMGDTEKRGVMLESMSALCLLLAGADILVMRHPQSVSLIREMIGDLTDKSA